MNFTRDQLRGVIEDPRTFRSLGRVIARSDAIDYAEVGGEVYLTADQGSLRFRILPSKHESLVPFVDELGEGRYVQEHFERLKKLADSESERPSNREEWKRLGRKMWKYQRNGKSPFEAIGIALEVKKLMNCMYDRPDRRRLMAEYFCNFHVHNEGEPLSKSDQKDAERQPEIIIIYHKYRNSRTSCIPPVRHASLVYVFPKNGTGLRLPNYRAEHHIFGPYQIESAQKPVKVGAA